MTQDQSDNEPDPVDGMRDWTPEEEAVLRKMRTRTTPFDVTARRAVGLTLAEVDEVVGYDRDPIGTPDEWGDLATWRAAAGDSTPAEDTP